MTPHIRWMIRRDMPEVLRIERASFAEPWTCVEFGAHLRERNCIAMVAERDERIVGYMVYRLLKHRIELLNLAVATAERRQGIGSALIAKLIAKLYAQRRTWIFACVSEYNTAAHLFFRRCFFNAVGIERGHFADDVDAYRFVYRIPFQRKEVCCAGAESQKG